MPEIIEVEFHSKYLSDFQLSRLVQASLQKYTVAITAFISDVVIIEDSWPSCLMTSSARLTTRWSMKRTTHRRADPEALA